MKKIAFYLIFFTFIFLNQTTYAQEIDSVVFDKFILFEKRSDSIINEINNFDPVSGDTEYDLYIINNVLPKTIDYILLMKDAVKKAEEKNLDIDFEFIIDELIQNLEEYKDILE